MFFFILNSFILVILIPIIDLYNFFFYMIFVNVLHNCKYFLKMKTAIRTG